MPHMRYDISGDLRQLYDLADRIRRGERTPEDLFRGGLLRYYVADLGGLDQTSGDLLYRLSDRFSPGRRAQILIFPSEDGSILSGGIWWICLEDWRRRWEVHRQSDIPQPDLELAAQFLAFII
jgi:hypothetical protein